MLINFILIYIIFGLLIIIKNLYEQNKINYSNYRNCLMALAEYDPKLKEYLENSFKKDKK